METLTDLSHEVDTGLRVAGFPGHPVLGGWCTPLFPPPFGGLLLLSFCWGHPRRGPGGTPLSLPENRTGLAQGCHLRTTASQGSSFSAVDRPTRTPPGQADAQQHKADLTLIAGGAQWGLMSPTPGSTQGYGVATLPTSRP